MSRLLVVMMLAISFSCYSQIKMKWTAIGPFEFPKPDADFGNITPTGMGWIESFASNNGVWWAGSNSGGLYKSVNSGENWVLVPFSDRITGVLDIQVSPFNPNHLVISSGTTALMQPFGNGVFESVNGGITWQQSGLNFNWADKKVVWGSAFCAADELVSITDNEIYLVNLNSKTSIRVMAGKTKLRQVLVHPKNGNIWYAAGNGLLVSYNKGTSWQDMTMNLLKNHGLQKEQKEVSRIALSVFPTEPDYLYAAYQYLGINYIQISRNAGLSWEILSTSRSFGRFDINHAEILVDPADSNTIYVGAVRMLKSTDCGKTFSMISNPVYGDRQYMHDDVRGIYIEKSGRIVVANDGGISYSDNKGENWISGRGSGLTVTQIYNIACHPVIKDKLVIGCQDLSSMLYEKGKWINTTRLYGDGGPVLYWQTKPLKTIVSQNAQLFSSEDDGASWQSVGNPQITNKLYFPLMVHPQNQAVIFAGWYQLWRRSESGWWENLSEKVNGQGYAISSFAIADADTCLGYLAFDEPAWKTGEELKNKLFRGDKTDGKIIWKDITANLPLIAWRGVTATATISGSNNELWVALDGLHDKDDAERIFYSSDGGISFTDRSAGLPPAIVYRISIKKGKKQHIWASTDAGLYYLYKNTWQKAGKKMPVIAMRDFDFAQNGKYIYAATYGGGVFKAKVKRKYRK